MEAERLAETLTSEFRTSPEGRWVNLREALSRLVYSPGDFAVGDSSDDVRQDFGVLLTRGGTAFSFSLVYVGKLRDHDAVVSRLSELSPDKRWIYSTELLMLRPPILSASDDPRPEDQGPTAVS
jgi:hypothetical protein